jgi:hypothetical protein
MTVQKLAKRPSFNGQSYIPAGHVASYQEEQLRGDEPHLVDLGEAGTPAVVQIAPITVTGPNPTAPQQIPPDAVQTIGGYAKPGADLVGTVTASAEERMALVGGEDAAEDTSEGEIVQTVRAVDGNAGNDDDALVAGSVKAIAGSLEGKSDEELAQLRAAEQDREVPRKGVISALDKEEERRKAAS